MITGMTGFGAKDVSAGKVKGVVEVKTVNHRYLDVSFHLPLGFSSFEERIQKLVSKNIRRGRVTVALRIVEKPQMSITLNEEAVKKYRALGSSLTRQFGMKNDLSVADLLKLPGVIETREVFADAHLSWPSVEKGLVKALESVVSMRRREGKALYADMNGQLNRMQKRIKEIRTRALNLLKEQKQTLTSEEFVSYQKSNDVNEELARLGHHIEEAKVLLKQNQEAGKKLDFIAQEMQRETNTIGSKVQDKEISAAVIAIKGKIEKIREQANNVE